MLQTLHWLPVKFRRQYKIATFLYRYFDGSLPLHPSALFCTVGERSFSFMAPTVWNTLPVSLRNVPTLCLFKSRLKTYMFRQAFAITQIVQFSVCVLVLLVYSLCSVNAMCKRNVFIIFFFNLRNRRTIQY